jgi:hypothetical protein
MLTFIGGVVFGQLVTFFVLVFLHTARDSDDIRRPMPLPVHRRERKNDERYCRSTSQSRGVRS